MKPCHLPAGCSTGWIGTRVAAADRSRGTGNLHDPSLAGGGPTQGTTPIPGSTGGPLVSFRERRARAGGDGTWMRTASFPPRRNIGSGGKTEEEARQQALLDAQAGRNIADKRAAYEKTLKAMSEKAVKTKKEPLQAMFKQAALAIEAAIAELDDARRHGGVGKGVAGAVASLAQMLLRVHPPHSCTYVQMGNSPAPLLAWLTLNGYGAATCHLPLGGLGTAQAARLARKIGEDPLPEALVHHLDRTLAPVLARGLPIVLIDYVSSGGSLVTTAGCIKRWLHGRGRNLPVTFFGYSEHTLREAPELNRLPHTGVLATAAGPDEKVFTKLHADKVLKGHLLIKGPATLDVADLLEGQAPQAQPAHWRRVLRVMRAALQRDGRPGDTA
jgi:hypothetical protein